MGPLEPGPGGAGFARRGAVSGSWCQAGGGTLGEWVNEFLGGCDKDRSQLRTDLLGVSW